MAALAAGAAEGLGAALVREGSAAGLVVALVREGLAAGLAAAGSAGLAAGLAAASAEGLAAEKALVDLAEGLAAEEALVDLAEGLVDMEAAMAGRCLDRPPSMTPSTPAAARLRCSQCPPLRSPRQRLSHRWGGFFVKVELLKKFTKPKVQRS